MSPDNKLRGACEVCDSSERIPVRRYSTEQWPVDSCANCGFVYMSVVPTYDALATDFPWEQTFEKEEKKRQATRWGWFDAVTRWRTRLGHWADNRAQANALAKTGRVLDIGCGGDCRVPTGPTPYGIEISASLAAAASIAFAARGGTVIHATAVDGLDHFPDGYFSAILMRSYLEHESEARAVLAKAFQKLEIGGTVAVRVPDYGSVNRRVMGSRWCGFRFPDHVNYFTQSTLKALVVNAGFQFYRTNWLSIFDDNIIAVLTKVAPLH